MLNVPNASFFCRCELEPLAVDAGAVTYTKDKVVHLILTNRGQVQASWQFAYLPGSMFNEPEDQALRRCPRWAQVSPEEVNLTHCSPSPYCCETSQECLLFLQCCCR